ncbi:TonB-dependent receptor [Oscillatoria sp. CS-180]|uniref:TonB-dependent receptor domain-containing protein n=1 Tax=Oscillatoria sp. CS-180 TaxID=3021720 RepID=UPI00232FD48B|nr:TonB-dependent receptor [Oscillatoria sp. CS-180]MDB9529641.1 TonB-dependent receptor [Oscillatoria sp. CS-180]
MQKIWGFGGYGAVVYSTVMALPAQAQTAQITNIEILQTEAGLQIVLTGEAAAQTRIFETVFGSTRIIDITNAQLAEGDAFQQVSPGEGIESVTVESLDANSIRIRIVGETELPTIAVETGATEIVVGVTGAIAAPPEALPPTAEVEPDIPPPEAEAVEVVPPEEESLRLVVTAARRPTPEVETSATVEVVTEAELEQRRPLIRTVPDALQTLPGITVNRLGLITSSVNIRGIAGERIGLLVDGERRPNLEFGPDFGSVDPFRVERIEVLQGPASSIYGADSFGGVVNVITNTPDPDQSFTVTSETYGGGFSEFNTNLEFAGPNYVFGATYRTAGDARDADGDIIPLNGTEYTVFDLYGAGRYDINDQSRFILRLDRYRQDDADLNGFPSPPFIETRNEFRETNRYSLAYINDGVPGGTELEVRGYYQRSRRQFETSTAFTIPGPFPTEITVPTSDLTDTVSYGITGIANTEIGDATLTYGYDFSQDTSEFEDLVNDITSPDATREFHGLFAQSVYNVTDHWTLTGGARLDFFTAESGDQFQEVNAVTFNLGTVYEITDGLLARANFAQGFRPPSLLFLFGSSPDGSFFAPTQGQVQSNSDLSPERANNIDIGLDYTSGNFTAGVVYFRNDISDFQGFETFTPPPGPPGPPSPSSRVVNKDVLIQGVAVQRHL